MSFRGLSSGGYLGIVSKFNRDIGVIDELSRLINHRALQCAVTGPQYIFFVNKLPFGITCDKKCSGQLNLATI